MEGRMAIPKLDAGSYTIPNSRTTIVIFTFIWMIVFMMITSIKISFLKFRIKVCVGYVKSSIKEVGKWLGPKSE